MKLYKHQQELLDKNPLKHLLAFECGTGKTITAILLAEKNTYSINNRILVICPKSIKDQWIENISSISKKPMSFVVMTKEEFKCNSNIIGEYKGIIVDECHFFANYKSGMAKALMGYIKKYNPRCIYLLTATPYLSSMWNLYTLGYILGEKYDWKKWDNFFFNRILMGRKIIPIQKTKINGVPIEDYIAKVVNKIGTTVKLSDVADVPEQQFFTEYFDLTKEQTKAIENIIDVEPIVRWTKIHQICGGSLKSDGYNEDQYFKSEKFERLKELCQEHKKIIIVCRYNAEIDYLEKELSNYDLAKITGKTKAKNELVRSLNNKDDAIVLVNASCSEGYELPTFPVMIFYSYDFSLKNYVQMIGRILRINKLKKNIYISLVVKGTIDEDVYKCINKKQDFQIALYEKEQTRS
jgi:superfamily II DNA or RNA helicase